MTMLIKAWWSKKILMESTLQQLQKLERDDDDDEEFGHTPVFQTGDLVEFKDGFGECVRLEGTRALVCSWKPAETNVLKIGTQLHWIAKSSICRALAFKKLGDGVHVWVIASAV